MPADPPAYHICIMWYLDCSHTAAAFQNLRHIAAGMEPVHQAQHFKPWVQCIFIICIPSTNMNFKKKALCHQFKSCCYMKYIYFNLPTSFIELVLSNASSQPLLLTFEQNLGFATTNINSKPHTKTICHLIIIVFYFQFWFVLIYGMIHISAYAQRQHGSSINK